MGKFIEIQEARKVLNEKNKFRKETLGVSFTIIFSLIGDKILR